VATPFCCLENDFTLRDGEAHRSMLALTKRNLVAAARCGATHVRLFTGFATVHEMSEPLWHQLIDAFCDCQHLAGREGLVLCIETHGALTHDDEAVVHRHTVTTERGSLAAALRLPADVAFNWDPETAGRRSLRSSCKLGLLSSRISTAISRTGLPPELAFALLGRGDIVTPSC
jgi:hypothetical protein